MLQQMDPQHHVQRNWQTASFDGRLVIHGLDQGQKRFPGNRDLHLVQEALTTRPTFSEDLLVVRKAQLEVQLSVPASVLNLG